MQHTSDLYLHQYMNATVSEPCMKTTAYWSRSLVFSDQIECRGNNKKLVTRETRLVDIYLPYTNWFATEK
jgi:hypothetical protein